MINKLIYSSIAVLFFPGCMFYSVRGSLPAHIHSISLAPVVNESTEFAVAEILNDEINKLMVNENVLGITTPDEADSHLEVVINSVTDMPNTVSLSDELGMEEVEEWQITIKTSVIWYDMKRDEILLEKKMRGYGIYSPGVDISTDGLDNDGDNLIDSEDSDEVGSPRESAMNISARRLTDDIVNEITNTW